MFCTNSNVLSVILLIKTILNILTIIIPIILIVLISIDIAKIVINPDTKTTTNVTKLIAGRAAGAILILFMPAVINLISLNVGESNLSSNNCWTGAEASKIELYRAREKEVKRQEEEKIKAEKQLLERKRVEAKEERELKRRVAAEKQAEKEEEEESSGTRVDLDNFILYDQKSYTNSVFDCCGRTIASHGCGPTSNAMVLTNYFGPNGHDPVTVTNDLCGKGHCYPGGTKGGRLGPQLRDLSGGKLIVSNPYTVMGNQMDKHGRTMLNHLKQGDNMIIFSANSEGNWQGGMVKAECETMFGTTNSHLVLLVGVDQNDKLIVANSVRSALYSVPVDKVTQCVGTYFTIRRAS